MWIIIWVSALAKKNQWKVSLVTKFSFVFPPVIFSSFSLDIGYYDVSCEVWSKCFFVVAGSKLCLRWFKTIAQLYMASCIPFTLNRLTQNGVWISRSSCPRGEQTLVDVIRKGVKIMLFPFPTFLKKKKNCRPFARLTRFVWFSLTC